MGWGSAAQGNRMAHGSKLIKSDLLIRCKKKPHTHSSTSTISTCLYWIDYQFVWHQRSLWFLIRSPSHRSPSQLWWVVTLSRRRALLPRPPCPLLPLLERRFGSSRQSAARRNSLLPVRRRPTRIHKRAFFFSHRTELHLAEMRRLLVVVTVAALLTGAWALRVLRVASFSTLDSGSASAILNIFLSFAENLALPIGKERQREDVVWLHLTVYADYFTLCGWPVQQLDFVCCR